MITTFMTLQTKLNMARALVWSKQAHSTILGMEYYDATVHDR